jgi:predicted nucleic acid-binding protein
MAEKCNRIKESDRIRSLHLLMNLPIQVESNSLYSPDELILLCQEHQLTAYDGIYLLVALSKGLPIASLDNKLNQSALKSGCGIYMSNFRI